MSIFPPESVFHRDNQPRICCRRPPPVRRPFCAILIFWLLFSFESKAQLIDIALSNAVEDINNTMLNPVPVVYPDWSGLVRGGQAQPDVMWSYNPAAQVANILSGQATNVIPGGDLNDPMDLRVQSSSASPRWITNATPTGLYAYVVVNASGLLDANFAGGADRLWSTSVAELDISGLPEITGMGHTFLADRATQGPYSSPQELEQNNSGISGPLSTLTTFSQDPGRDQLFLTTTNPGAFWWQYIDYRRPQHKLGQNDADQYLRDKFDVNSITNYAAYYNMGSITSYVGDIAFFEEYYLPLSYILFYVLPPNERPDDVAWNIVNYLDPDRIPQGGSARPWTNTQGGEPIPMINEIVVRERNITEESQILCMGADNLSDVRNIENPERGSPYYTLSIELWYPYAPLQVSPNDNFSFQLGIFGQRVATSIGIMDSPAAIQQLSLDVNISDMEFGTDTEFLVFEQTFGFHTNGSPELVSLGDTEDGFWFIARVSQRTNFGLIPVDEAIRNSFHITRPRVYQVNDPRSNGHEIYWRFNEEEKLSENLRFSNGMDWDPSEGHSLGQMNITPLRNIRDSTNQPVCDPWSFRGHGLPIFARNGPMHNIAELGHIFRSNLDDGQPANSHLWLWRNINLMHRNEGANLLDYFTAWPQSQPISGLFNINSRQTEATRGLFHNLSIGIDGVAETPLWNVHESSIDQVLAEMVSGEFTSFTDMFTDADEDGGGGGPLADAFRECAPDPVNVRHANQVSPNDIYKEDTFRHICELISFRQNLFIIILGAVEFQEDGMTLAREDHSAAYVYRDAYTGKTELIALTNFVSNVITTTTMTSSSSSSSTTTTSTSSSTTTTSSSTTTGPVVITETSFVIATNYTINIFTVECPPSIAHCGEVFTQEFLETIGFAFYWPDTLGRLYAIDELIPPSTNWNRIHANIPGTPPITAYSNLFKNATNRAAVYRVMKQVDP